MAATVLIVDDVKMFVELEKGFLQRSAVKILTAGDGQEALRICQAERPALVFMDLHMPIMNGADCCRAIKKDRHLSSTAVVLITSEGKEEDRQLCLNAGCDYFLTKPLDRHLFLEAARKLLPAVDRRDRRIGCHIKAKYRAFGITLSATVTDISQNGVYLATEAEIEKDTIIDVIFALPVTGSIVQARARVAWVNSRKRRRKTALPEGFGLEYVTISEEASNEVGRFLQQQPDFI